MDDVKHALRMLRRSPGFSVMAIVVLALAIAANTAIFSVINALLLRPLPVRAPEELTFVYSKTSASPMVVSYDEAASWAHRTEFFNGVATMAEASASIGEGAQAVNVRGEAVSANYFEVLGVGAVRGRVLGAGFDDRSDAPPAVVISDRLWRNRFGADPAVIGKPLRLATSGRADSGWRYHIVGIMPAEFQGIANAWAPTDFWVPWQQRQRELDLGVRIVGGGAPRVPWVIARRQPGVTVSSVEPFILSRLPAEGTANVIGRPRENVVVRPSPRVRLPLDDRGRISVERLSMSVLGVGALVLAIGIINLIGVTIARAMVRGPEMALRLSLGASRVRLARQMVCEALMLSVLGGLAGLGISRAIVGLFLASLPAQFGSGGFAVPLDWRVMAFALFASVAAGLTVGLAPVRRASRVDLLAMLGASHATSSGDRARLRSWIVVPQIAVCMTLLLVAGIAIKALLQVSLLDPGYRSDRVAYVSWSPTRLSPRLLSETADQREAARAQERARQQRFMSDVLERARAEPSFAATALSDSLPTSGDELTIVRRDDYRDGSPHLSVPASRITDGYFGVMALPLRSGRLINEADTRDSPKVAVIDEGLAARLWPEGNPIGRFIGTHSQGSTREPEWIEVVGIVGAVRHPLSEGETRPFVYLPLTLAEAGFAARILVARGRDDTENLTQTLRSIVAAVDPETIVSTGRTLDAAIGELRYPRRIGTALLATAAAIALGLACLGLYGVVSFSVARRVRELGIRAALGADRRALMRLVMREGAVLTAVGCVAGLVAANAAVRLVSSQVLAMPQLDRTVILAVCAVLGGVVMAACYLPARRAARVNPASLLRS